MKQPINIVKGQTKTFLLSVLEESGAPHVLTTGEKLALAVKRQEDDRQRMHKEVTQQDYDPVGGVYQLKIMPQDTADMPSGEYYYDIMLYSDGDIFPVIEKSPFTLIWSCAEEEEDA